MRSRRSRNLWGAALVPIGLSLIGLLALACSTVATTVEVRCKDGSLSGRGAVLHGLQQGDWQFFHPNGQRESSGSFVDDARDGLWRHWYADGSQRMEGRYAGDRQVGPWRFWHQNGQLACQGTYVDGREHGEWSFFFDNGQLQQRGCFCDGKRVLRWCTFERDGSPRAAGVYLDDQPVGVWSEPAASGGQSTVEYATPAGMRWVHEVWDDGSSRREGFVRDGKASGLWVTRHRGGALRCTGMMAGRAEGSWQVFAADGSLVANGPMKAGRLHDTWSMGPAGDQRRVVTGRPSPPWNGTWSEASILQTHDPLQAVEQWLGEAQSPVPAEPVAIAAAAPAVAARQPTERLEAPTDPGRFTVREQNELETYRRYYRDGFLPRRSDLATQYGGSAGEGSGLGTGDSGRASTMIGRRLPVTKFHTVDGDELDLDTLRGRKVLLVILRGFTTQVCVYCFAQTAELAPVTAQLADLGCELVVLFPGTKSRLEAFRAACEREFGRSPAPYRLAYDPDLALAKALGIEGNLARPSSLLLDAAGIVRFAYVAESVQNVADRPPAQRLVEQVRRLDSQ